MTYQVIDDFLDIDEFNELKNQIVFNSTFPFALVEDVAQKEYDNDYNAVIEKELWNWYGTHLIYNDYQPRSEIYTLIGDFLLRKIQSIQEIKALIRIKVNFYPHTEIIREHSQHQDRSFSHKGAIFSLNTCDGFTRMPNGDKVDSIENRIVFFDPVEYHNSSTTTNQKGRFNINFNWF